MLIQCSHCKEAYEAKSWHKVNWCAKPECRAARAAYRSGKWREQHQKSRVKAGIPLAKCRCCGGSVTGSGELWCQSPECRDHRDQYLKAQKRNSKMAARWREKADADGYRIAKGEKVSLCRECGAKTPNRLGLCDTCRRNWLEDAGLDCMVGNMANAIYDVTEYWPRREGARA